MDAYAGHIMVMRDRIIKHFRGTQQSGVTMVQWPEMLTVGLEVIPASRIWNVELGFRVYPT